MHDETGSQHFSLLGIAAVAALFGGAPAVAANLNPVLLEVRAPLQLPLLVPGRMMSSGWPLEFRATIVKSLGLATTNVDPEFAIAGMTSFSVFDDPDNCLEFPPPFRQSICAGGNGPPDETYAEFTLDVDQSGADDQLGNYGRAAVLGDDVLSGGPLFLDDGGPSGPVLRPFGPPTGGVAADGYGRGADDDLPGLVILSPVGVGLELDPNTFDRASPLTQHNLAGFLNYVQYELRNTLGYTGVTAGLLVPEGLFRPLLLFDGCVGVACADGARYRVDGGPVQSLPLANANAGLAALRNAVESPVFEIRAFLVSGTAPDRLSDLNGDDRVNAADARAAGYLVLSNEVVVRYRLHYGRVFFVSDRNVVFRDLDSNGSVGVGTVGPPGPGQIRQVPR